jgi:hypothetical protein
MVSPACAPLVVLSDDCPVRTFAEQVDGLSTRYAHGRRPYGNRWGTSLVTAGTAQALAQLSSLDLARQLARREP